MDTFDAIEKRRSVKHYYSEHKMTGEQVKRLLSSAILSPTFNIQNWRFLHVNDPEIRKEIRKIAWDQPQVIEASVLLVLCGDLKAWEKQPQRCWKNASKEAQDFLIPAIDKFYRGNNQTQRDECMRSCSIAAQTIMLAAKAMGYDSNPMIGFDSDEAAKIINLPEDHVICLMLVIGKASKPAQPRGGQLSLDEVVITDKF